MKDAQHKIVALDPFPDGSAASPIGKRVYFAVSFPMLSG